MGKQILFDCDRFWIDNEIVSVEEVSNWLLSEGVNIDLETYISEHIDKTFSDIINLLKAKGGIKFESSPE